MGSLRLHTGSHTPQALVYPPADLSAKRGKGNRGCVDLLICCGAFCKSVNLRHVPTCAETHLSTFHRQLHR